MATLALVIRRTALVLVVAACCTAISAPPAVAQVCGDGVAEAPEECDGFDDDACVERCTDTCTCAVCGNGVTEPSVETCDGADDGACPGLCYPAGGFRECQCPICGDGVINQASEQCERLDDAACPGHCAYGCVCAVCGNDVPEFPIERCDGVSDGACPGQCFPPGDAHECVCPLTLNKCAGKKQACMAKRVAGTILCQRKADRVGAPVDQYCLDKVTRAFEGDGTPYRGCIPKLELPGQCFVSDQTEELAALADDLVAQLALHFDPSYPTPVTNDCTAKKKRCAASYATTVLACHTKAEIKDIPVDPVCLQKANDKLDGGLDPTKGCLERIENGFIGGMCLTHDDAPVVAGIVNEFVLDVVCAVDPYRPECG